MGRVFPRQNHAAAVAPVCIPLEVRTVRKAPPVAAPRETDLLADLSAAGEKIGVISPIGELSWGDRDYKVNDNKIGALSQKLYDELTGIQWGTKPDPFGWVCPID